MQADTHAVKKKTLKSRDDSGQLRHASLKSVFPWARSVVVCAINYNTAHPYSTQVDDPTRGWISRYAWSRENYHDSVLRRLREVEGTIKNFSAPASDRDALVRGYRPDCRTRICQICRRR